MPQIFDFWTWTKKRTFYFIQSKTKYHQGFPLIRSFISLLKTQYIGLSCIRLSLGINLVYMFCPRTDYSESLAEYESKKKWSCNKTRQTPSSDVYPQVLLSALLITIPAFDIIVRSVLRTVLQKKCGLTVQDPQEKN